MNVFFHLMKTELIVTIIIFLLLFVKLGKDIKNEQLLPFIQFALLVNFIASFFYNVDGSLFGDMFYTNSLIAFEKSILSLGVYLISMLSTDWLKKNNHLPEFFMLMLSALLGMCLLLSSGNLLIFYLSLELATIPIAAMANFDLLKKRSSEAAMKMILSSAFSSGILLFGISLIYGITGTISFAELPKLADGSPLFIMAFVFLFSSFAFKLSIVPFHLWTADVYEGSPIAVTSFLSVVSKATIAFVLLSVLSGVFQPLQDIWYVLIVVLSVASMLIGNLFALRQENIKRFLAFSSIAQVGFILVGVSGNSNIGISSVVYFMLIYMVSNLAAFGVASVISEQTGKENISDYKGLYKNNPLLGWVLALALFSLAGIPPTAGFFGKLYLLTTGGAKGSYLFISIAALNMIISLFYYLRVVRAVFIDKNDRPIQKLSIQMPVKLALFICSISIVLMGIMGWIFDYIESLH